MLLKATRCIIIELVLAGSVLAGAHAETVVELDAAQTRVEFTLGATLHKVHGRFQLKHGVIRFDPATGKANGALVIESGTGESGNAARDRKMHKVVLESERYPEMRFVPDRVEGKLTVPGTSTVGLHGVFSIHGSVHEMLLPVQVTVTKDQLTATASFVVPYVEWGLKNPSTFILRVEDKVDISIHAAGRMIGH